MSAELIEMAPERLEPELIAAWRELAVARENPFLTPEWCRARLEGEPEEEPFLIAWRPDGELRGMLPLVRSGSGRTARLSFVGARRGDWFTPACAVADEEPMAAAVAELLVRERGRWGLLRLDRVDRTSAWPAALWEDGGGVAPALPRRLDVLPYVEFGPGGYEEYLAGRSRNFRSQLGRRRRKLEKEHRLEFRLSDGAERLDADMSVFFALHEERWRERGGSSSGDSATIAFQRRFAALAQERGWLRLWICEVDEEPAAAWYGWRLGDRYCYALSGLAKRYEESALGTVLLAHTIESAAGEGARVYDMMWGDESYKERFQTGRREAATWVLRRRRDPRRFGSAARTGLERKARELRER